MEEFKITNSLAFGKYVSEKGIPVEIKELYNTHVMLSIGDNVIVECRDKATAIAKIKKLCKYLKKA